MAAKKYTNVQKSVMHVQSCCFVSLNLLLLIGRFRWRPLRRCLRSPFIPIQVFIWDKSNSFQQQLVMADSVFKACCSSAVWQCLWMVRWASLIFARFPYIRLTIRIYWLLCSELYHKRTYNGFRNTKKHRNDMPTANVEKTFWNTNLQRTSAIF